MKKISFYLAVLMIVTFGSYKGLAAFDKYYENKVKDAYFNSFGNSMLTEKNEGLILQRQSINRKDNMQIYGSSELGTPDIHTNPVNIFNNKSTGFQINLIGRGYSQSITHAINIGALSGDLKDEKMVIILSPQWFSASGLAPDQFQMNFSELQFYSFMYNKNIDSDLKLKLASRVTELTRSSQSYGAVYQFASLYAKNNIAAKTGLFFLTPYNRFKFYLLSIKDNFHSYRLLLEANKQSSEGLIKEINYDWEDELVKANEIGKEKSSNNSFGIANEYYNKYIKDGIESYKDSDKGKSYVNSPEYEDLKLLLELSKRKGLKPIFVSVPVHGKWYDYCGFPREDRQEYYKKVNDLIKSFDFQVVDLSNHEYEEYFLKDTMHLGWRGWIYIDKAINEYYHNNK
jgi:D-alanine transfer protein